MKNLEKYFRTDRSDRHGEQVGYNNGLGNVLRHAVYDPEASDFEHLDMLPKHESQGKHARGWGRRYPISWKRIDRWIKGQVGRHVDDVYSDFVKIAKGNNKPDYASRDAFHRSLSAIRGEAKVCLSDPYGWPFIGIVTPEGHIEHCVYSRRDVYTNTEGIICRVTKALTDEVERVRLKQKRELFDQKVIWRDHRAFVSLKNQWYEVIYEKVDPWSSGTHKLKCVLCTKLHKNWHYSRSDVFGYDRSVICVGLRSISNREIERLFINVAGF